MAYYRLSTMMKLKRELLGHSRDDFDVDGPSGMTVYRMEEGKNKMSESSFRKLTRAMGMEESTGRGLLRTKELEFLMEINKISNSFFGKKHEEVEENIHQMKRILDLNIPRNLQYISYIQLKMDYRRKIINVDEYREGLQRILFYTCPSKEEHLLANWPYCMIEWKIFMDFIFAIRRRKDFAKQKELAIKAEQILLTGYLEKSFEAGYMIGIKVQIVDALGNMGFHEKAIEMGKRNLLLCEEHGEMRFLPEVYYDIFWNYNMLKKNENNLTDEEEFFCKQCLIKAYYLNKALFPTKELYLVRLQENYPDVLI